MRLITSTVCSIVALCVLSLTPDRAIAQEEPPRQRGREDFTLATYEVGDLIVHVPDYSLSAEGAAMASAPPQRGYGGGGFGGGGGGFPGAEGGPMGMGGFGPGMGAGGVSGQQPQITIDSLRNAIVNVVAPESWALNQGSGQGRIEVVGTALVVSQDNESHQAISQLLDQLRNGSATRRTVAVEARWLLLNSDELDRLVTMSEEGERRVDRKTLDEFTRRPTSLRGATKCFSGQAVYVISGTQRSFVSSYIPVVGSAELPQPETMYAMDTSRADIHFTQSGGGGEGMSPYGGRGVGYQPIITTPNFGATLEVRPTLSVNGDNAVIDLQSTVTFPSPEQQLDPAAMPGMPQVDRVAIQMQKLATTLRVPLGEPVLVGGMTYLTPASGDAVQLAPQDVPADPGEQRQLYLVIELR